MNRTNLSMLNAALRVAKSTKAKALFISLDSVNQYPEVKSLPGCQLLFVTKKSRADIAQRFSKEMPATQTLIELPKVDMTRMSLIKTSLVLAANQHLINIGDKVIFLTGIADSDTLDSILCLDTSKESEVVAIKGIDVVSDSVKPEVFQSVLGIAIELATRGREGKPVGTTFVIGDEQKVMQLSKQMIINPFKGYTNEERNLLSGTLKETLREFAALDGAFVISGDGLVLTAGRYLGGATDESPIPRGLGSRHIAAAGITALTDAFAIVISESTGDVRIFKNGKVLMEIEKPMKA